MSSVTIRSLIPVHDTAAACWAVKRLSTSIYLFMLRQYVARCSECNLATLHWVQPIIETAIRYVQANKLSF